MTAFAAWTWSAIVVLIVGSSGVFVWFLGDAWRMMRALKRDAHESDQSPL